MPNIFDGALTGALAGILAGRPLLDTNPASTNSVTAAGAANAFATQFLVANAALAVPMVETTTNIALVVYAASYAELFQRNFTSVTPTDYTTQAAAAAAKAKATAGFLT